MILEEVFVEKEYVRYDPLTPKCLTFKKLLLKWFGDELFSFTEVMDRCEPMGIHRFAAVQWLNMMFKHGDLRKFVRGRWAGYKSGKYSKDKVYYSPGKYYGVHYKMRGKL